MNFSVTLSNPFLGTTIEGPAAATITIFDDDPLGKLAPTIVITTPTADLLLGNHDGNDLPVTITYLKDVGDAVIQQLAATTWVAGTNATGPIP